MKISSLLGENFFDDILKSYTDVNGLMLLFKSYFADAGSDFLLLFKNMNLESVLDIVLYIPNVALGLVSTILAFLTGPIYYRVCGIIIDKFFTCDSFLNVNERSEYSEICVNAVRKLQKENWEIQSLIANMAQYVKVIIALVQFAITKDKGHLSGSVMATLMVFIKPFYGGIACVYMSKKNLAGKEECLNQEKVPADSELKIWIDEFFSLIDKIKAGTIDMQSALLCTVGLDIESLLSGLMPF